MTTTWTPKAYPRTYLDSALDGGSWDALEPVFDELAARPWDSPDDVRAWLHDLSELSSAIGEERARRYVAMTCHTDDATIAQAYQAFVETIEPKAKERGNALHQRLVKERAFEGLGDEFAVLARSITSAVERFREENLPLETMDKKLDQQYGAICGAMTVTFDGAERTLPEMGKYLTVTDRSVREAAWRATAECRQAHRDTIDDVFDAMIELRKQMATQAGFPSYVEHQFAEYDRFDYTPADCLAFHTAIESVVVPARRRVQEARKRSLGVDVLRPWDLSVDPDGGEALKPFADVAELVDGCSRVFHGVESELGAQFDTMAAQGWLDLDSRKGKAPGGYQVTFDEERRPFIFMNAVGLHRDVTTLLHEGGHAFHAIACRDLGVAEYRHAPTEWSEVASMGMELLAHPGYDVFYDEADARRAKRQHLEGILDVFCSVAVADAFQHRLYRLEDTSRGAREALWADLTERFSGLEEWSGLESLRAGQWQRILHFFTVPLYYVEYGIAQIGALQLWARAQDDREAAIRDYRRALALGGSRPLPELFEAAGLRFDFTEATLRPLIERVVAEIDALDAAISAGG